MSTPVVLANNTFNQACKVHCVKCPCTGAYTGPVQTPGQDFVKVDGNLVVLSGITHTYGCPDCSSDRVISGASDVLKINGSPVALMGSVTGLHSNGQLGGSSGILSA